MSKRAKIRLTTYICAAILTTAAYAFVSHSRLADYRLTARHSSQLSFQEMVGAVDGMSKALEKSLYATDGSMCSSVCAQIYAGSQAAQATMATLPFSTQELERISGFVGLVGDYAYTLCREASVNGFTDEQRQNLAAMAETSDAFAQTLRSLQTNLNDGVIRMDSRERQLANVGIDSELTKLSAELKSAEDQFPEAARLIYDGKYSYEEDKQYQAVSEEQTRRTAAEFLHVSPDQLRLEYEYEGGGRRCYSLDSRSICTDAMGVESMTDSRLVSEAKLDTGAAEQIAVDFLANAGFENMQLSESSQHGAVAAMCFVCTQEEAACLDSCINIAVALDNGSIYAFDATGMRTADESLQWTVTKEEAEQKLPAGLSLQGSRKVTCKSPGGSSVPCYELKCSDEKGREVKLYINAVTGLQQEIEIK